MVPTLVENSKFSVYMLNIGSISGCAEGTFGIGYTMPILPRCNGGIVILVLARVITLPRNPKLS